MAVVEISRLVDHEYVGLSVTLEWTCWSGATNEGFIWTLTAIGNDKLRRNMRRNVCIDTNKEFHVYKSGIKYTIENHVSISVAESEETQDTQKWVPWFI